MAKVPYRHVLILHKKSDAEGQECILCLVDSGCFQLRRYQLPCYLRPRIRSKRKNRLMISMYSAAAESMALSTVLGMLFARAQS